MARGGHQAGRDDTWAGPQTLVTLGHFASIAGVSRKTVTSTVTIPLSRGRSARTYTGCQRRPGTETRLVRRAQIGHVVSGISLVATDACVLAELTAFWPLGRESAALRDGGAVPLRGGLGRR